MDRGASTGGWGKRGRKAGGVRVPWSTQRTMESIEVAGLKYQVHGTYLRSVTQRIQTMLEYTPENLTLCTRGVLQWDRHPHYKFYKVSRHGEWFWIKETARAYGKGIGWEARQHKKIDGWYPERKIGSAKFIAAEGLRIVAEYLDGYTALGNVSDQEERVAIVERVKWWLDRTEIENYDVSENNTLIKGDVIKMIDFEWYSTRTRAKKRPVAFRRMIELDY